MEYLMALITSLSIASGPFLLSTYPFLLPSLKVPLLDGGVSRSAVKVLVSPHNTLDTVKVRRV